MDGKPFTRPCIKCRKSFRPKDRKREWYCSSCRRDVNKAAGVREVKSPDLSQPSDGDNGDYTDLI